jgi:gliding motility-associated-like protein
MKSLYTIVLLLAAMALLLAASPSAARINPPAIEPIPNDTTLNNICDLLPADTLMAVDIEDGMLQAIPVDMPDSASIDPCLGGVILRIWEAVDSDGMMDRDTQVITINPDTIAPVFVAPVVADYVVHCDSSGLNSLFSQWKNQAQLTFSSNIGSAEDCSGVNLDPGTFIIDLPDAIGKRCDTLTAHFTFEDICGNVGTYEFSSRFIVYDTVAPVLLNLPADTVEVTCDSIDIYLMNNPASMVTVDDCQPGLVPAYTQDTLLVSTSCLDREFNIRRRWAVSDSCGNTAMATQILEVRDNQAPSFTLPPDITISCDDDALDLSITGDITDTLDQCGGPILLFFNDNVTDIPDGCDASYRIMRNWTARDACGNQRSGQQTITVNDTEGPTFMLPPDTTVNCGLEDNLLITGEPTLLMDNCDDTLSAAIIAFEDIIPLSCENNYIIERNWRVSDECGNETTLVQEITVIDTLRPTISLPPTDVEIICMEGPDILTAYQNWLDQNGGAIATDNCTPQDSLEWTSFISGTSNAPSMPPVNCPANSDTILIQTVDFIVMDDCGNRDTTTATFLVRDTIAPVLENCQVDTTISTNFGQCSANFTLRPPYIQEECAGGILIEDIDASAIVTSDALPGQEGSTPVDPVILQFNVSNDLPINTANDGSLTINLLNADAEGPTEYFNVFGEDGTLLGRTGQGSVQCGNTDTVLVIPELLLEQWAVDGTIIIRLEPNVPTTQPGSFAINPICAPQTSVEANLNFIIRDFIALDYAYKVNEGATIPVDPIEPVLVTLPLGSSNVTYYVSDCAGNIDSCTYMVTVEDQEPPTLDCPDDISVPLEPGNCSAMVTLPLPDGVTDNCALADGYMTTMPLDTASAYLTFSYDPNLNDYLPNATSYSFTDVAANAFGTVSLTVDLQGDFNSSGAFINIIGDSGQTLGSTNIGIASCASPGQATFNIPADTFNVWAADGNVTFEIQPNPIPVPPGQPGDGINPCDPQVVDTDGEVDSVTYVFLTLTYQEVTPFFFAEGATDIPYSQMIPPAITPSFEFNVGETEVSYVTGDDFGNLDTCTFIVDVVDDEPPVALCQATIVEINPSGLDVDTVSVAEFDDGSFDNCQIDTMFLQPNTFTCEQAGTTVMATLTVIDLVGNTSTCTKPIRIEAEAPAPDYSSGICGGDTLYLFANPPVAQGQVYTFRWFNPLGLLISTQENPVIPNVDADDAGAYRLEIVGLTGCVAEEVINVSISNLPLTPTLVTNLNVCNDDDIVLGSSITLNNATYHWYEGLPPGGNLIQSTNIPELVISGPLQQGVRRYYLIIEANGCASEPSSAVTVNITNRPVAVVNESNITVCEDEPISLSTSIVGVQYQWTGPDDFNSNAPFPMVIDEASTDNAGVYELVVIKNGCVSEPDFTIVNVIPKPPTPILTVESGPVCEGETIVLKTLPAGASIYQWTGPGLTPFTTNQNTLTLDDADNTIEGVWWVETSKFGCKSDTSNFVNVVVNEVPNAMVSANPAIVCERDELELFATPGLLGATYSWTGPNGNFSVAQNPKISSVDNDDQGQYSVLITTAEGCQDTASVLVDVLESPSIVAVSNDAPGCLYGPTDILLSASVFPAGNNNYTYQWTGPSYSSSDPVAVIPNATAANNGSYSLIVSNNDGCSSLPAFTMVSTKNAPDTPPTPAITAATPPPFCNGDEIVLQIPPYSGNGVTYTWVTPDGTTTITQEVYTVNNANTDDTGGYSVFVNVNGCDSDTSNQLMLTVNSIPQAQAFSNSPVCEGQPLELISNPLSGATYQWSGPINSSLPNPVIGNADPVIHPGEYCLAVSQNGCTSPPACTQVEINEAPMTPMVENNGPVCIDAPGAALVLSIAEGSGTAGATYVWYGDDENLGSTQSENFLLTDFGLFDNGNFDFYVEAVSGEGCFSDPSVSTLVQMNTIPEEEAMAAQDTSYCLDETVNLTANTPTMSTGAWSWIDDNGSPIMIQNINQPITSVQGLEGGNTYDFLWSLSNGACADFSIDTIRVEIKEPETAYAGEDTLLCSGDPILLNALIPEQGTGMWSQSAVQSDFNVIISDPVDPFTPIMGSGVRPGNTYVFTWTVASECGESEDDVFVTISDNNPRAGQDQIACNDEGTAQLMAIPPAEISSGRWSSPDGDILFSNRNNPETLVENLAIGDNIILWTLDEGYCGENSVDTLIINYQPNPVAVNDEVTVEFAIEAEVNVLLNDEAPPFSFINIVIPPGRGTATVIGDSIIAYTPDPDFIGTDVLTYEICSDGCECDEGLLSFVVGQEAKCDAPNIITPNGDGINDVFTVPCLLNQDEYPDSQVYIFNRWGDEVFRSGTPYLNTWDGTFNGEELPADTYFYVINFGNGQEPLNGYLLIQR